MHYKSMAYFTAAASDGSARILPIQGRQRAPCTCGLNGAFTGIVEDFSGDF
jgi:hypothetical protein